MPKPGYENGQVVPIHYDALAEDIQHANQARDLAKAGFVGFMAWVNGTRVSQSRRNVRYRALAARWVTDPTTYRQHKQKDFARQHGINPQSFNRAVNRFSKHFGVCNEKMRLRPDCPTYTQWCRNKRKTFAALPRKL